MPNLCELIISCFVYIYIYRSRGCHINYYKVYHVHCQFVTGSQSINQTISGLNIARTSQAPSYIFGRSCLNIPRTSQALSYIFGQSCLNIPRTSQAPSYIFGRSCLNIPRTSQAPSYIFRRSCLNIPRTSQAPSYIFGRNCLTQLLRLRCHSQKMKRLLNCNFALKF